VHAVVAKYLTYSPGCTSDNGWCNAPEVQYTRVEVCGCSTPGARTAYSGLGVAFVACALAVLARRRRVIGPLVVVLALLIPAPARRLLRNRRPLRRPRRQRRLLRRRATARHRVAPLRPRRPRPQPPRRGRSRPAPHGRPVRVPAIQNTDGLRVSVLRSEPHFD